MEPSEPEPVQTEIEQPKVIKEKKPRTPAQIEATKKMVEATRQKRENARLEKEAEIQQKKQLQDAVKRKLEEKIIKKAIKIKSRNSATKIAETILIDDDDDDDPVIEKPKPASARPMSVANRAGGPVKKPIPEELPSDDKRIPPFSEPVLPSLPTLIFAPQGNRRR